jgi:hypothetical protein
MAADSKVHVVLINPAGTLIHRQVNFNPAAGSAGVENMVKSALKVVAVFVQRDLNGDTGGPWWDEYSTNNQYAIMETYDGVEVKIRDITGPSSGVRTKSYFNDLTNPTAIAAVAKALEESTMGSGANWAVLDDGAGSYYEQKLNEAKNLVGLPGGPF